MIKKELKNMIDDLDLQSSIKEQGEYVTQIIHFVGGIKRTYDGIKSDSIRQGQFTKFKCKNGALVMINDANVLMIEVFSEDE
ncbi:hypothetical protein CMI47_09795 [Candidatus Pacearchaeota archaeon]|nr:hypothetical protein [Candidatus Pacearchaeota archaeon]